MNTVKRTSDDNPVCWICNVRHSERDELSICVHNLSDQFECLKQRIASLEAKTAYMEDSR